MLYAIDKTVKTGYKSNYVGMLAKSILCEAITVCEVAETLVVLLHRQLATDQNHADIKYSTCNAGECPP